MGLFYEKYLTDLQLITSYFYFMFGITNSNTTFVRQLRHKNMEILNKVKFTDDCYYSLDVKHGNETLEIEYNIQIKEWIITKHVENENYMGRIHIKSGKNFDFSLHTDEIDIEDLSIKKITLFQRTYNSIKHLLSLA